MENYLFMTIYGWIVSQEYTQEEAWKQLIKVVPEVAEKGMKPWIYGERVKEEVIRECYCTGKAVSSYMTWDPAEFIRGSVQ